MNQRPLTRASLAVLAGFLSFLSPCTQAAEPLFSGPQPGEKTTPFKVQPIVGVPGTAERDPIGENRGLPTVLVFLHGIERSLVPLLRVIDEYGIERRDRLRTELVFLSADRTSGEQRVKAAANSLKLQSPAGLSVDGAEGPGNYGLNRDCLMTIVGAARNVVVTNFALRQPGIADAPQVISALARLCGDTNPPAIAQLSERHVARGGGGRGATERMAAEGGKPEVKPKETFPGAVPTDDRLQGLLRSFIRPTNDIATVDRILAEVKTHIKGNADLKQQAVNGWIRILHFGDRYGTEYARKTGREFLEQLKHEAP